SITGSALNNLRFPGQYFLLESGLYYNWHRHYDPTLGRYLQPDSLGFVDGPSLYAYARSQPTALTDPAGSQSSDAFNPSRKVTPVFPDVFDEWRKHANRNMRDLWNFVDRVCRPAPTMLFPLGKCLDYCVMGSPEQMLEFCRKYTSPGTRNAQRCLS